MKTKLLSNAWQKPSGVIFYGTVCYGILANVYPDVLIPDLSVYVPNNFGLKNPLFNPNGGFWMKNNIMDELLVILIITSGLMHTFSKEKQEDEMVNSLRLAAMKWALIANFTMILFGTVLIYGIAYFQFMSFSLFSLLIIYNLKFRMLYRQHLKQ
jgi:hypothetical protein